MKFILNVMKKNEKLKIDNEHNSLYELSDKLFDEVCEVNAAIQKGNIFEVASELFDVIQICINILFRLRIGGIDIEKEAYKHNKKLNCRGWERGTEIKINVKG